MKAYVGKGTFAIRGFFDERRLFELAERVMDGPVGDVGQLVNLGYAERSFGEQELQERLLAF